MNIQSINRNNESALNSIYFSATSEIDLYAITF